MWHNRPMKKLILLLPALLLLSSCNELTVGFTDEEHEAGLDRSVSREDNPKVDEYSYIKNDTLNNEGLNKATLTFTGISKSETNLKDYAVIGSYVSVEPNIFIGVNYANFFNTKEEGYAFIGADSTYVDGKVTFAFNTQIKNIEIKARPYSYIKTAFNEESLIIDHEVAICVNDKGYIKLDETALESGEKAVSSTCSFALSEPFQEITIKVGKRRAVIEEINLYY